MRPTVDEELDGALRLLDTVVREEQVSAGGRDRLRDVERLVRRVRGSWSAILPFLVEDNATLVGLLHKLGTDVPPDPEPGVDITAVAARNEQLRERLSATIRVLPAPPEGDDARVRIGTYLQRRVDTDPT